MRRFEVTTEGQDRLGLAALLEAHASDCWIPDHLTPEQAEHFVMDHFRRLILGELELLEVRCVEATC